ERSESTVIYTVFGRFNFTPIEIYSNKKWKINTPYGIFELPSNMILSAFLPDINSLNKNIIYLFNGDYFFYNSVWLKDSLFNFSVYNYTIKVPKKNILFLKDSSYNPKLIHSDKPYRININNELYLLNDFIIKDDKIYLNNKIIKNPKILFISNSIINLFILNDKFLSGISAKDNTLFVSGYSKKFYEIDIIKGIKNTYNLETYSYDFPTIINNKIYLSGFNKSGIFIIDLINKNSQKIKTPSLYSGISIINKSKYLIHLWSKKLLLYNINNDIINSFNVITSKRSPLIDYEGYIIDLDISGNLYKFDSNLNVIWKLELKGKTDYFNIDKNNNIYINGPDNKFSIIDKNGNLIYVYSLEDIPSSFPLIDEEEDIVYVSLKNSYLYALKNNKVLWKTYVGLVSGTGVLTKKYIILNNLKNEILFINRADGKIEKALHLGYSGFLSMDNNGYLFFSSSKGLIAIIDVNDQVINQYKFNIYHTGNPYIP
ncbi:PQQ-binding-like beta-propeller repeat protein, partial [Marinitoga arctica]